MALAWCRARLVVLAALGRAADRPRPRRGASARPSACARHTCTARALVGSTRAPSSHTRRRPRKLRLRCVATDQQRQAPPTELDRRARRASIAPRTDTFAVLCITAEERGCPSSSVGGRAWALGDCARAAAAERRAAAHTSSGGPSLRSAATPAEIPPRTAERSARRSVSAEGHPHVHPQAVRSHHGSHVVVADRTHSFVTDTIVTKRRTIRVCQASLQILCTKFCLPPHTPAPRRPATN